MDFYFFEMEGMMHYNRVVHSYTGTTKTKESVG
jgi:hypothetical protein